MCNVPKRRTNSKRFNLIKQLTPNIKINCSCKTQPVGVSTTTPRCVLSISGSHLALRRHGAREEEVGDGGEEEAAGGDEKPHPPGPHPAGVAQPQLLLRPCQTHPQRSATIAPPETGFCRRRGRVGCYRCRFCPRPRRCAARRSPAGSRGRGQRPTLQTGWLWRTRQRSGQRSGWGSTSDPCQSFVWWLELGISAKLFEILNSKTKTKCNFEYKF